MGMKYTSASDIGLVREENQDYYVVREREDVLLAVVCDGIGGGNAGSLASKIAVETLVEDFERQEVFSELDEITSWFGDAITKANHAVVEQSQKGPDFQGMGTTMIALVLLGDEGFAFNIGDSRLYRYSQGELVNLSHDQTYAYEMYRQNRITYEEIAHHPRRNVLMNAVGIARQISYEVIELEKGWDQLLLSSDGLHDFVEEADIKKSLTIKDLDERKDMLIQLAYKQGAYDNISIIIIEGDQDE